MRRPSFSKRAKHALSRRQELSHVSTWPGAAKGALLPEPRDATVPDGRGTQHARQGGRRTAQAPHPGRSPRPRPLAPPPAGHPAYCVRRPLGDGAVRGLGRREPSALASGVALRRLHHPGTAARPRPARRPRLGARRAGLLGVLADGRRAARGPFPCVSVTPAQARRASAGVASLRPGGRGDRLRGPR